MIEEKKFSEFIKAGDWEGARQLIEDYTNNPISESERAEALVMLASLYMQVKNDITRGYLEALRDIRATMIDLDTKAAAELKRLKIKNLENSIGH